MNALILAAGLGTRLKPLTDNMPKAMVPVGGKPLIWHLIQKLKTAGFTDIVVNVHHFASQITDYLSANGNFGLNISISDETDELLETGGAIKKAAQLFPNQEPFLVHNVDIMHNLDLGSLFLKHSKEAQATLFVSERHSTRHLLFSSDGQLKGRDNDTTGEIDSPFHIVKSKPENFSRMPFSGIHIFSPTLLPLMETWPSRFPVIPFYLQASSAGCSIRCAKIDNLQLLDVGKLDTLDKAEQFIINEEKTMI